MIRPTCDCVSRVDIDYTGVDTTDVGHGSLQEETIKCRTEVSVRYVENDPGVDSYRVRSGYMKEGSGGDSIYMRSTYVKDGSRGCPTNVRRR